MKLNFPPLVKKSALLLALVSVGQCPLAQESAWDKPTPALPKSGPMTVYRSPSCGCCGKWIEHMKKHGFEIKDVKTADMEAIKRQQGVPESLASCHTAVIDGIVVEGHVPAGDLKKALTGKAKLLGLAAPGMPAGSPGMEMPGKKDSFSVIAFDKQGNGDKFSEHSGE